MSDQKTERATPQREKKAAEQGDWVRSRELAGGAGTLAGLMVLGVTVAAFPTAWRKCLECCIRLSATDPSVWDVRATLRTVCGSALPLMTPAAAVMGASVAAVIGVCLMQSRGLQITPSVIQPKFERVNPAGHAKSLFSMRALVRLVKSVVPATVVLLLGWRALVRTTATIPVLSRARLPQAFSNAYGLAVATAAVMVVWAAVDYVVERRAWSKRLRMSKQEIKEELKESMGSPQVKGRIRQMQRAMRRRKVKADIRRAAVVVTNPTHYAVALEFDMASMQAPRVLCKGRDLQALDIKEEARWADVPVVENPPLARSLYRSVDEGQAIPYELYAAVAGILAWLFQQKRATQVREAQQRERRQTETNAGAALRLALRPTLEGFEGGM